MSVSAAQAHQKLLEELRSRSSAIVPRQERVRGPRTALPPGECERADCYFHQHYGPGCKAALVVMEGYRCLTYRQLIGEVCDHA